MAELPNYIGFRLTPTVNGPDADGHVTLSVGVEQVDVSRLVFCEECKHYKESIFLPPSKFCYRFSSEFGRNMAPGDFCSVGERKSPSDA